MKRQKQPGYKGNRKTLASFLLLYIAASAGVVTPLLRTFSYLVLQASGLRYVTAENMWQLLRHPVVYAAFLAGGLLYACFELFEISGLIYIQDRSRYGVHITFFDTASFALRNVRGIFHKGYFLILLAVLVITPAYHLGSAVNLLTSYTNFALFLKAMQRHWYLRASLGAAFLLLIVLFLRWFYVCHYYTLEAYNFRQAGRRSRRLIRRQRPFQILAVFGKQLLAIIGYMLISLAGIAFIGAFRHLGFSGAAVSTVQVTFLSLSGKLFDALFIPLLFFSMGKLYYAGKEHVGELLIYTEKTEKKEDQLNRVMKRLPRGRRVELGLLLVSFAVFLFYMQSTARSQFQLRIQHLRTVEVSAHRGASMYYPENTMAAFIGAVEQGADWIELDVQESRDGKIFVMHDESLKRTTGVDQKSWELDYNEIAALDAGSFFNADYAGETIPLLSEVIAFAQENNIRLNIELKPNEHQEGLVDGVLDEVEAAGFEENCVITSQKYEVLRQVKSRNENIHTVYVMGLAYGAINRLKAADAFSIRSTSITQSLVTDLHNRGLEVYAWTVDSRANLNRMINLGVDNIITNNVPLAIECINTSRTESILGELLKMIADRFR